LRKVTDVGRADVTSKSTIAAKSSCAQSAAPTRTMAKPGDTAPLATASPGRPSTSSNARSTAPRSAAPFSPSIAGSINMPRRCEVNSTTTVSVRAVRTLRRESVAAAAAADGTADIGAAPHAQRSSQSKKKGEDRGTVARARTGE
jgi:hypothetical protein